MSSAAIPLCLNGTPVGDMLQFFSKEYHSNIPVIQKGLYVYCLDPKSATSKELSMPAVTFEQIVKGKRAPKSKEAPFLDIYDFLQDFTRDLQ